MQLTFLSTFISISLFETSFGFIGDKTWPRNYEGHSCTNDSSVTDRPSLMRSVTRTTCPPETNLICSSKGICECPSADLVYVHDSLSCLPIASPENGFACSSFRQCKAGSFGRHSTCNTETGTCECHIWNPHHKDLNDLEPLTSVQLIDGVCYLTINTVESAGRTINFQKNLLGLGDICERNDQCTSSIMGPLSRCNLAERKCECYDTKTGGKNEVGLYEGKCWVKRTLGQFCEANEECRFGWHTNAICIDGDSYIPTKICTCPSEAEGGCSGEGEVGGGGTGIYSNLSVGLVLISSALLKIMTAFV